MYKFAIVYSSVFSMLVNRLNSYNGVVTQTTHVPWTDSTGSRMEADLDHFFSESI